MATFNGTITHISAIQSGTSKNGNAWRKIDAVLEYQAHETYPKAIVFSVMNDKIEEFDLRLGGEYEVEVYFSAREYNGKFYMSASAWKAAAKGAQPTANSQQGWEAAYPPAQPKAQQTQTQEDDGLPF